MAKKTRRRCTNQEKLTIFRLHLPEYVAVSKSAWPTVRPTHDVLTLAERVLGARSGHACTSFALRWGFQGSADRRSGKKAQTQARSPFVTYGRTYQDNKILWGALNRRWDAQVTPDTIVQFIRCWASRAGLSALVTRVRTGISLSKFSRWSRRLGTPNQHSAFFPRDFWLEEWEKAGFVAFRAHCPVDIAGWHTRWSMPILWPSVPPGSIACSRPRGQARSPLRNTLEEGIGLRAAVTASRTLACRFSYTNICRTFFSSVRPRRLQPARRSVGDPGDHEGSRAGTIIQRVRELYRGAGPASSRTTTRSLLQTRSRY